MRYFIFTKKQMMVVASLITTVVIIFTGAVNIMGAAAKKKLPIYCVDNNKKQIALSFDAAWGNADTQQLIDILGKYNVKATFFVVGEWADKYPDSVKQFADAGHSIMNHSDTHPHPVKLSAEQMKKELADCNQKIEKITGKKPSLYRAPYGEYNDTTLDAVSEMGMYTIQWDCEQSHTKVRTAQTLAISGKREVGNSPFSLFFCPKYSILKINYGWHSGIPFSNLHRFRCPPV